MFSWKKKNSQPIQGAPVEEKPFDMRDTVNAVQFIVNVIMDNIEKSGTDVSHWDMNDMAKLYSAFARANKLSQ